MGEREQVTSETYTWAPDAQGAKDGPGMPAADELLCECDEIDEPPCTCGHCGADVDEYDWECWYCGGDLP